jgi:Skp family chaperone for outer membrane proteins
MTMPDESMAHLAVDQSQIEVLPGNHGFSANSEASIGNLDKIKELLFGAQVREYDNRLARLEERIGRENSSLREEMRKRFEAIEQYIYRELSTLTAALKTEQTQREAALNGLDSEFRDLLKSLERQVGQLEEQTNQRQRELRQQLIGQSKTLDDEIRQKYQELVGMLDRKAQDLRAEKVDRASLASLFREVAMRMNNPDLSDHPQE